jgi:hypothetical protein
VHGNRLRLVSGVQGCHSKTTSEACYRALLEFWGTVPQLLQEQLPQLERALRVLRDGLVTATTYPMLVDPVPQLFHHRNRFNRDLDYLEAAQDLTADHTAEWWAKTGSRAGQLVVVADVADRLPSASRLGSIHHQVEFVPPNEDGSKSTDHQFTWADERWWDDAVPLLPGVANLFDHWETDLNPSL